MAYAKTTPAQVIAQLAIGAGVGSLAWYSVRREEPTITKDSAKKAEISPAEALEAEARATTTGKLWGLTDSRSASQSSPPTNTKNA